MEGAAVVYSNGEGQLSKIHPERWPGARARVRACMRACANCTYPSSVRGSTGNSSISVSCISLYGKSISIFQGGSAITMPNLPSTCWVQFGAVQYPI